MLLEMQLRAEHSELIALADELEALLPQDHPGDLTGAMVILGRFDQLLNIHLLREDAVLYPALLAGNAEVAQSAREFLSQVGDLDEQLRQFDAKWSGGPAGKEYPRFREDLVRLLSLLRERIERENSEIFPLMSAEERRAA